MTGTEAGPAGDTTTTLAVALVTLLQSCDVPAARHPNELCRFRVMADSTPTLKQRLGGAASTWWE